MAGTASDEELAVAKTESRFSRCREWQCGHSGTVLERTSVSKVVWQDWQVNSKMGMAELLNTPIFAHFAADFERATAPRPPGTPVPDDAQAALWPGSGHVPSRGRP